MGSSDRIETAERSQHEVVDDLRSNDDDLAVMAKIGKRQQFRRIFGFLPTLALSVTLLSSWEAMAAVFVAGLFNGGPVSLVYGMILTLTGVIALAASLAEMASICPISGAQYHWTYMFAPKSIAPFLTWMQGWITVFAWQASAAGVVFLAATQIQALVILNYDDYVFHRWHGTLIMWAILLVLFVVNVYMIRLLPIVELLGGICHVVFFIVILTTIVVLAPRSSATFVFTAFINEGGWSSDGVSWCVGLLTVIYCMTGFDGAIHLSEEVKDSTRTIPRVIMLTIAINWTLAFGFLIGVLFCLGNVNEALNTPTGFPIIAIFQQATGSIAGATALESCIIVIAFSCSFGLLASVSRLTWAFARDGGLPFSKFFSHVDPHYHIPVRAIALVCFVSMLLSLINIGSSIALNAILSLSTIALFSSYIIPISLLVRKRLRKEHIEFGPWKLGRFGIFLNLYGIGFAIFIIIFLPFPAVTPVDAQTMNYAGPVFLGLIILSLIDWLVRGRHYYAGPIQERTILADSKEPAADVVEHTKEG